MHPLLGFVSSYVHFSTQKWAVALAFILGSRLIRRFGQTDAFKSLLFAALNFFCVFKFFQEEIQAQLAMWLLYVAIVMLAFWLFFLFRKNLSRKWLLPFWFPLLFLIAVKICGAIHGSQEIFEFIGISYLALRLSRAVVEVRNGSAPMPSAADYLGFAFFLPTFVVGPINTYSNYKTPLKTSAQENWNAIVRIFIGLGKFQVLGVILSRLTFANFIYDDYKHPPIDLFIASAAYYLFLYCNFSGYCDMMIGIGQLAGFKISENFNFPLRSRNIKDFWNRWHITLSEWVRDMIFTPLSKSLLSAWGPRYFNAAIAASILVVFSIVGLWHGIGLNFLAFGLLHAFGLIAVHYYTFYLRKYFPKQFKRYNQNRFVAVCAWLVTFVYVSATFGVFQNSAEQLVKMPSVISWKGATR